MSRSVSASASGSIAPTCPTSSGRSGRSSRRFSRRAPARSLRAGSRRGSNVEVAGLALRVLHTPGHTPGGVCLIDEASREILVGDTIFCRGVGRTDLPGGDGAALARSIREKLFVLGGDYRLLPGHGPETGLDEERRENPFVGATVASPAW